MNNFYIDWQATSLLYNEQRLSDVSGLQGQHNMHSSVLSTLALFIVGAVISLSPVH